MATYNIIDVSTHKRARALCREKGWKLQDFVALALRMLVELAEDDPSAVTAALEAPRSPPESPQEAWRRKLGL